MGTLPRSGRSGDVHPTVLAAVHDVDCQAHVCAALGSWCALAFVDHIPQLPIIAARTTPDIVLWHLESFADRVEVYTAFAQLRRQSPRSAVIAYIEIGRASAPLLLVAGRVGVDGLLLRGFDDLERRVYEIVTTTSVDAAIRETLQALGLPPGSAQSTFAHCLHRAMIGPMTVSQLACELRVDRKTVGNWLRSAGLPPPERLIGWSRMHAAASLLADPRRSISDVARALGFSSDSDLRHMVSRYLGCTPSEMRRRGGRTVVVAALRARIPHRATGTPQ